ncbi:MAG TPA: HAD-IA family hydrolase [Elusimicrobiota bacterium]|nr:HAD-IA family hydrolase [Elusimicrobiota bacterium]
MSRIKAVFFDAGGTLFRPHPSVGHVYAGLARKYGCDASAEWVDRRFRAQWRRRNGLEFLKNTDEGEEKAWWSRLVRAVFGRRMSEETFRPYFEELYDLFAQPKTWRLFPDALPTLKKLKKRGVPVGIVSNWDSRLFELCRGLGVAPWVDFILASAVVGSVKPHPGIFQKALKLAGVRPSEAIHVGDSFREDYCGATRAGLKAVWLCRAGGGSRRAACIGSLADVGEMMS